MSQLTYELGKLIRLKFGLELYVEFGLDFSCSKARELVHEFFSFFFYIFFNFKLSIVYNNNKLI